MIQEREESQEGPREERKIVVKRIGQTDIQLSQDEGVLLYDLAKLYAKGEEVLREIGEEVASLLEPLGPSSWVNEGIIGSANVAAVFIVGNCLVQNRFFPTFGHANHEFVITGTQDEVDKVEKILRSRVPRYFPCLHFEHRGAGSWNEQKEFVIPEGSTGQLQKLLNEQRK